ncbi:MAG: trypsin-like peptidase domain-containing protein [Acidobacteriota bacterium]
MIRIFLPSRIRLAAALLAVAAVSACMFIVPAARGQSANKEAVLSPEARALVRQAIASTALVSVRNSSDSSNLGPRVRGSAVVVRADGVLVTNYHVILNTRTSRSYDEVFVSLSGDGDTASSSARYRVKPLLINKEYDLALLRVESDAAGNPVPKSFTFPSIEMADSLRISLLEDLFIIGFPERGGSTVTINRGVVEGKDLLANWIKTDARVIHGNSGGAAVNSEGKLVGIPTKVLADEQAVDRDGDGFPDDYRRYGAVGFLRPSHLVAAMLAQLDDKNAQSQPAPVAPKMMESSKLVSVRGLVRSAASGKPIAGALVGLLPLGEISVTETSLLTWASTNSEGEFRLNRPVPPGRYTLKAKALAKQAYTLDIEIVPNSSLLIIEMRASDQ